MSYLTLFEPFVHHHHSPFHHHHYHPYGYQRRLASRQPTWDVFEALAREQAGLLDAFDNVFGAFEPVVRTPSVELKEEGKEYVIEAELPGVKKEDLEVTVGEGGKTITIEGKVFRREEEQPAPAAGTESGSEPASEVPSAGETPAAAEGAPAQTAMEVDRPSEGEVIQSPAHTERTYSSMFSRTFSLPQPVDGARVSAKLVDGMLTLRVPKVEDTKSMRITVE